MPETRSERSPLILRAASITIRVVVGCALLAAAGLVFVSLRDSKVEPAPVSRGESAALVRVIAAPERVLPRVFEGFGTARAMDAAVVAAQVSARVMERPDAIEPGKAVSVGGLIVELESIDFASRVEAGRQRESAVRAQLAAINAEEARLDAQVRLAEEEIEIDERDLARIRDAAEGGSGTQADIDQRIMSVRRSQRTFESLMQALDLVDPRRQQLEADLANITATVKLDEENLARTRVVSPIDGTLQSVSVEAGEFVRVGDPIARVVNIERIEVPLQLPVSASSSVRIGDSVDLRGDGPSAASWTGEVTRIAPETDAATRTMTVFVEVDNGDASEPLLPGQFVMGRVRTTNTEPRILVPRRAVSGDRVLIARGQSPARVEPVDVDIDYYTEIELERIEPDERQWAVLKDGLFPGDLVIVSNLDELVGGMLIEPVPVVERAAAAEADAPTAAGE